MSDGQLTLLAPVSGVIYPLERVPDPVFSQKLAGDGISIDPTDNILRAPCPGEIIQQHAAMHAVTLKTAGGVEVLMHVGIDTVALKGKGFTPKVKIGDKVETGAPLIEFDLDYVATNAKSLLTEVIISNGDRVSKTDVTGRRTATVGKTPVLTLTLNGAGGGKHGGGGRADRDFRSDHSSKPEWLARAARGGAQQHGKNFKSDVRLQLGDRFANARSVTSLLALETALGDKVVLVAKGPDAREAVDKLTPMIAEGLGDEGCMPASALATMTESPISAPASDGRMSIRILSRALPASSGLAVGEVFQVRHVEIQVKEGRAVQPRPGAATARRRHRQGAPGNSKPCGLSFMAKANRPRPPSSPRTRSCSRIRISSRSPPPQSPRARARPSPGRTRSRLHAERLAVLRNNCSRNAPTILRDVGVRVLGILTGDQAQGAILSRQRGSHRRGSHAFGHRHAWSAARSWASRRCAAARLRTWRFSRARSAFPALAGIEAARARTSQWHARDSRRQQGHAAAESVAGGDERICARRKSATKRSARKISPMRSSRPSTSDGHRIEVVANIGGVKDAGQVAELGGEGVGPAALRVSLHGARRRAERGRAVRRVQGDRRGDRHGAAAHHPHAGRGRRQAARLTCRSRRRTIPSSASAASASGSTGRRSSARNSARFSALRRSASCTSCSR